MIVWPNGDKLEVILQELLVQVLLSVSVSSEIIVF
jgi:hypothetical protein